ncbi:hypothetical protein ACLOJK_006498, partial [Asimina triloba]
MATCDLKLLVSAMSADFHSLSGWSEPPLINQSDAEDRKINLRSQGHWTKPMESEVPADPAPSTFILTMATKVFL